MYVSLMHIHDESVTSQAQPHVAALNHFSLWLPCNAQSTCVCVSAVAYPCRRKRYSGDELWSREFNSLIIRLLTLHFANKMRESSCFDQLAFLYKLRPTLGFVT